MIFTTFTYFIFVAAIFNVYWAIRLRKIQNIFLICGSFVFYAWWDYRFASLILLSALIDYLIGFWLSKTEKPATRKGLLLFSITANLAILGIFKYFGFFLENFVSFMGFFGIAFGPLDLQIVLPVGISFYTLQTMGYTIDVYRKKFRATKDFVSYLAFVSFFPQLVAGPIERAGNLIPQFMADRQFNEQSARDGLRQLLWGFAKKALLANNLANQYFSMSYLRKTC